MGKILILTNHSYMLYRFRLDLLKALAKQHEVILSMPFVGHETDFQKAGFRCIETPVDRRGWVPNVDWKLFRTYRRLLKQEKPDLVISYSIKPNIYGGIACRLEDIPYCANVQGLGTAFHKPVLRHLVCTLYRIALKNVQTTFFENTQSAHYFLRQHILPENKMQILNGAGIDLNDYSYHPYPENHRFRFLYMGRIMKEKGINELLCAAQQLHAEGYPFALDMVGFFEDSCKKKVQRLHSLGILCFHGFQDDPVPFYDRADCVILPSYHEGMSNVLLEAAATGRPVIASDIPGCREAVEHGVSGLLCPVRDTDCLYEAMKKMLQLPPQQRRNMGKAGRAKMEREFDKQQIVEATIRSLPLPAAAAK